jgi:phage tail sheath protein FI
VTTAVYLFFANGGSQAYINRVIASDAVAATKVFKDATNADTLTLTAKNVGKWGNSINISIVAASVTNYFDVVVYYGGSASGNVVERFTDLTMDPADARYATTVINGSSVYLTAVDPNPTDSFATTDNPAVVTNTALSTGVDGTALTSANLAAGVSKLDVIDVPMVLNVPGLTATTDVNTVISYIAERGDIFLVIDPLVDTVSAQNTRSALYTPTSQAAVYYPSITIADPTTSAAGATKVVSPGGAVVGQFMATDASRGVFKSPAGLGARISGAVSVPKLTNAELDSLNSASAPANAIRYIPGSGIVIMGARTLKTGYADRYVSVRRSLIYLRKSLSDLTQFAVFEPNDFRLWRRINTTIETFLTDFWHQGGLRGGTPSAAFYVKCDSENNPLVSIENGQVNIEVGVALQRPAEFVVIRISQYDSGAVVTIA